MFRFQKNKDKIIFLGIGFILGVLFVAILYKAELKVYGYFSEGDGLGRLKAFGKKMMVDSGISRLP